MTTIGLYSDSDILGGAERSMLNLVSAYRGEADLVVLATSRRLLDEVSAIGRARPVLVPMQGGLVGSVLAHRRLFLTLGLDLLQVNLANPFVCRPALLGGFLARVPTIGVEHLVFQSRRRSGRLLTRGMARLQAATVAVGDVTADDLHRIFGIPRRSVSVVHNGVPDRGVADHPLQDPAVVGCAARLEHQKGVDLLLAAMAQVAGARLVLVGDGSERDALQRRAEDLGIVDRVEFAGWLDDARDAIGSFDVFALASRNEAFPLTIVEAMLGGTPVVATDVGSVAEAVVDGVTGLLVPPGDVEGMAAALVRMLDDPAARHRMATAARAMAEEQFTDVAMARAYDELWRSILQG